MSTEELTPIQQKFLSGYLDPQSPTWSNAYQSAKNAGYAEQYCLNITGQMPNWLSESMRDASLVATALTNLSVTLGTDNPNQWDATKFTLKGLKSDSFSERKNVDITSGGDKIAVGITDEEKQALLSLLK